jgi:hypothetical protein
VKAEEQVISLQPQTEEENMEISKGEMMLVIFIIGSIFCAFEFFLMLW